MNQQSKYEQHDQGLYRGEYEHDACGVGMVANLSGEASHDIVVNGIGIISPDLFHETVRGNHLSGIRHQHFHHLKVFVCKTDFYFAHTHFKLCTVKTYVTECQNGIRKSTLPSGDCTDSRKKLFKIITTPQALEAVIIHYKAFLNVFLQNT